MTTLNSFLNRHPDGKRLYLFEHRNAGHSSGFWDFSCCDATREVIDDFLSWDYEQELKEHEGVLTISKIQGGLCYGSLDLEWRDDPWYGCKVVACCGAHYGFAWGNSADDVGEVFPLDESLKTGTLRALLLLGADPSLGFYAADDPTDDGSNFVISNEKRFLEVAEACKLEEDEYDECEDEEGLAMEVLGKFRCEAQ